MADTPNNISKLLNALMASVQDVENALQQLLTQRTIDTATGVQLDVVGRIVGQTRDGLADADYRRYIRARIAAHRSNGVPEDLIRVAALVLGLAKGTKGVVLVRAIEDASFILEIHDQAVDVTTATALQELLLSATSAGVRLVLLYSAHALASTFRFDSGPGFDVGHLARCIDATGTPA